MMNAILSWSGGKDSALALYYIQKNSKIKVKSLLTTLTDKYDRISMHGVRRELVERQAAQLNIPLELVYLPTDCSNEEYGSIMARKMRQFKKEGINRVIFGDIFLEDIRRYREENLAKVGIEAQFPLWNNSTEKLATSFIDLGFRGIITCVDSKYLPKEFIGRYFNHDFLSDLPDDVDPCGENGEFHSFVYDGPTFEHPITFTLGEIVLRDNQFYFVDLLP
jgi:uncharacterized protein (TIGR00290 family)